MENCFIGDRNTDFFSDDFLFYSDLGTTLMELNNLGNNKIDHIFWIENLFFLSLVCSSYIIGWSSVSWIPRQSDSASACICAAFPLTVFSCPGCQKRPGQGSSAGVCFSFWRLAIWAQGQRGWILVKSLPLSSPDLRASALLLLSLFLLGQESCQLGVHP